MWNRSRLTTKSSARRGRAERVFRAHIGGNGAFAQKSTYGMKKCDSQIPWASEFAYYWRPGVAAAKSGAEIVVPKSDPFGDDCCRFATFAAVARHLLHQGSLNPASLW